MIKQLPINKVKELCHEAHLLPALEFPEWWQTVVMPQLQGGFDTLDKCEELWKAYPDSTSNGGVIYPLKTWEYDKFTDYYVPIIISNKDIHNIILNAIDYAEKQGLLVMGFEKFLKSRQYETIIRLMNMDDGVSPISTNEDF